MTNKPPAFAIRCKADKEAIKLGCFWDQSKADEVIDFAETVFRPQYIAGEFRLLEWQKQFLSSLMAWRKPDGSKRIRTANLHISKKAGKTLLVSIISAFELLKSEEPSPFVATGSVSKENAAQVYKEISYTLARLFGPDGKKKYYKETPSQKRILVPSLNSEYRSLASDGDTAQGYNISTTVIDEGHAHKNAGLYDSLRYSTIARPGGLLIVISTAGDDVTHWYYKLYRKSKRVLSGEDTDITHLAYVYEADADCDIDDVEQWRKACPSLGTSFSEDQFRLDLEAARSDPAELNRFKRYRLNLWIRPEETAYFDVQTFDRAAQVIADDELKKAPCWLGCDLSQTVDPSSVSAVWALPNNRFYVKSWAWVCRQAVQEREASNLPLYDQFKTVTVTDGDRIDDRKILNHLLDLTGKYQVKAVIFDPMSAMVLMGMLEAENVKVMRMSQTHRYYSAPMKEFSKAIAEQRIIHDGNEWLRYCLQNVRIDEDRSGNIRPAKNKSIDKIDGAMATLMAFSQAGSQPAETRKSVYDSRPIFFVGGE